MALYQWVVRHERLDPDRAARELELGRDEVDAAVAALTERGLLKADVDDPARLRPVDPDLVAAVVTTSLETSIRAQQAELHRIRDQFASLRGHYLDSLRRVSVRLELIPGLEEVRAALNRASAECTEEMLTSQPGGNRVPAALKEALARDMKLLSGVCGCARCTTTRPVSTGPAKPTSPWCPVSAPSTGPHTSCSGV
ncbi:hypothetical protein NKH77_46695 [Streptomyces sp. M19]